MSLIQNRIIAQLSNELGAKPSQIQAAVQLLDEGATVPFISRYRKEATGGLDDTLLRNLQERLTYLRELEERRTSIIDSIETQGKLTPELKAALIAAENKQTLEDLYLPYKQKRRTRAQIAREAGLQPLADAILAEKNAVPQTLAQAYLNAEAGITDTKAALEGARDILAEQFSENATLLARLRNRLTQEGAIRSAVVKEKENEAAKFQDYFEHQEAIGKVASHRVLAMLRGRELGFLTLKVDLPEYWALENARAPHPFETEIANLHGVERASNCPAHWKAKWWATCVKPRKTKPFQYSVKI